MALFDSVVDYFRRTPKTASVAKDRLSVIVARERASTRGGHDYLPQLQQELLAVLAKYEKIDLENVSVKLDKTGECEVLELNIILPDDMTVHKKIRQPGAREARVPG
jgi:cell division topological specificity factor